MPQKSKKQKQMAALRREVELLRAQVKTTNNMAHEEVFQTKREVAAELVTNAKEPSFDLDFKYLSKDIRKTAILTGMCLLIIFTLYFTESRWMNLL
ncbi:hypothetical protein COY33_02455 [candidate division WWE3 bacterium CG_4_10_14_0_2_um_filter_42_7]|uniref:Uncharacterized protein n=1 Tax=candidate division WWE3 bacterium CG_4_10_14_0_2_um_filter_42_7 TaxID=1975073 RepID=A0A2M7TCA5_UNCKA|nr:MAG: hypothetical protein COY33_02455 [candidate division WWE3 bacterium CG_4_10_14_0_2_um_filter_42_7]